MTTGHYDHEVLIDRAIETYYDRTGADRDPKEPGAVQREQCRVTNEDGRMCVVLAVRNTPGQPEQVVEYGVVDHEPDLVLIVQGDGDG